MREERCETPVRLPGGQLPRGLVRYHKLLGRPVVGPGSRSGPARQAHATCLLPTRLQSADACGAAGVPQLVLGWAVVFDSKALTN